MRLGKMILLLSLASVPLSAAWIDRKAEGWAWYEDPEARIKPTPKQDPPAPTETMEEIKKNLDDLRVKAVMNPTDEAVLNYMQEQQKWVSQAMKFSQTWNRMLLAHPELDPNATSFATTQYGRRLQKELEQGDKEGVIHEMSQVYGLFLLYEGNDRSSQAFAKVVRTFADKYAWTLMGVSTDGVLLEEIPLSREDQGFATKIGVHIFPALIAFDNQKKVMIPLAFGLQSIDQIERNVSNQFQYLTQTQETK